MGQVVTAPSRPPGRPSLYRPEYCEQIVEFMRQGYSLTAFAGEIGVCRETLLEWQGVHEEFSIAVKLAKAARTRGLEETLLKGETGPRVTAHIFALKNAAPDEWRDRHELTGANGGAIRIEDNRVLSVEDMTPDERYQLRELLDARLAQDAVDVTQPDED